MKKPKPVEASLQKAHDDFLLSGTKGRFKIKRHFADDARSITKIGHLIFQAKSELYEKVLPSKFHLNGKAPAFCVDVVDVEHGDVFMLICNTVLASKLQSAGSPIAGRYFEASCGAVEEGTRYRSVELDELEGET